jgi:hypothetical protein
VSPVDKMKQYADTHISSDSRSPSTAVTPHIMSTTNSITSMSIQAREKFTPVGTKYQSKTKRVERDSHRFLRTSYFLDRIKILYLIKVT